LNLPPPSLSPIWPKSLQIREWGGKEKKKQIQEIKIQISCIIISNYQVKNYAVFNNCYWVGAVLQLHRYLTTFISFSLVLLKIRIVNGHSFLTHHNSHLLCFLVLYSPFKKPKRTYLENLEKTIWTTNGNPNPPLPMESRSDNQEDCQISCIVWILSMSSSVIIIW
jgi:hypothetical protein